MSTFIIFRIIGWLFIVLSVIGIFSSILTIDKEVKPISRIGVIIQIILTTLLIWFIYTAMQI